MRWEWDDAKNRSNLRKHRISFESASLVFEDPLALSVQDLRHGEDRWHTLGAIGGAVILVVHTWSAYSPIAEEETGRIISARKATSHERRAYEEGTL
ncbi:MAG: BrnT family toxin [Chloroflexota bacterium]|nr:BrnT family toxin [Chloroflexota bacterium]MDE2969993.1 BrnT family toxin [Chloroflexota bacterium]